MCSEGSKKTLKRRVMDNNAIGLRWRSKKLESTGSIAKTMSNPCSNASGTLRFHTNASKNCMIVKRTKVFIAHLEDTILIAHLVTMIKALFRIESSDLLRF